MRPFVVCVEVVIVAARITDKKRKKIVADYLELGSYNATAKKNKVSNHTVKRIVQEIPDIAEKVQHKKEENTADILAYMESKRDIVCEIIGKGLAALNDPEKLAAATPAQITTALGTLIDKFTSPGLTGERISPDMAEDNEILKEMFKRAE